MNKAIKYRLYPTTEQDILFIKTFGCCRKVYNLMLNDKLESYKATGKFASVTPAMYKRLSFPKGSRQSCSCQCAVKLASNFS